jgi:hypothetical protein
VEAEASRTHPQPARDPFDFVSIIRPTETDGAAMGAAKALADSGLFIGQSAEFFAAVTRLAEAADAARRGKDDD